MTRHGRGCSVRDRPSVSSMDDAGCFSFGAANEVTPVAACHGRKRVVEVNGNMPRVEAIVAIAHPGFGEDLFREAEKLYLV